MYRVLDQATFAYGVAPSVKVDQHTNEANKYIYQCAMADTLDEDEIEAAENLEFRRGQPYFEKIGEQYIVTDALFGSLINSDGAENFDIVGAGSIHTAIFSDPTPPPTSETTPTETLSPSSEEAPKTTTEEGRE